MQILAMHQDERSWSRSPLESLLGWGSKGTQCGSELLRFPGSKQKTQKTKTEIPKNVFVKTQHPLCSSSDVLTASNRPLAPAHFLIFSSSDAAWLPDKYSLLRMLQIRPKLSVIEVFQELCTAPAEESMRCSFSRI